MYDTHTPAEWAGYLSLGLFAEPDPGYYKAATFDAAVTVAALLMLLSLTAPEATR